jgi:hypothetical protein
MTRAALLLALALLAQAGAADAAGPSHAEEETEEKPEIDPAEAALPNTMRRHGVIGHVPRQEGLDILDAEILAGMRARLVMQVRGADE